MKRIFAQIRGIHSPRPAPLPLPPKDQKTFEESLKRAAHPSAGDEIHPAARAPPAPEFEGDVNPATGEQGGPKREPLRHGDWSFNGRATDF